MITLPILTLPDFSQSFVVETNASGIGLGAVPSQNQRHIAYYSRFLSPRAQVKPIYERELMAVVKAVQRWRPYLLGHRFIIRTDQQALRFLVDLTVIQLEYQRWVSKLLGYSFEVQYRPGLKTKAVDGLSRLPPTVLMAPLTAPAILDVQVIKREVAEDPKLQRHYLRFVCRSLNPPEVLFIKELCYIKAG